MPSDGLPAAEVWCENVRVEVPDLDRGVTMLLHGPVSAGTLVHEVAAEVAVYFETPETALAAAEAIRAAVVPLLTPVPLRPVNAS